MRDETRRQTCAATLQLHKVCDKVPARISQHTLGVKLNSLNLVFAVTKPHDGTSAVFLRRPGTDFQLLWEVLFVDNQGVIPRRGHRDGQRLKNSFVVVYDCA